MVVMEQLKTWFADTSRAADQMVDQLMFPRQYICCCNLQGHILAPSIVRMVLSLLIACVALLSALVNVTGNIHLNCEH
jgi:hypothetical protein